ncbi:MAG: serine/threonine protein kinase [Bdellovibrionaceae bacterium]|nr:serine/threonine protein kinase [Pseudobdellovibrionaceae bacterium]
MATVNQQKQKFYSLTPDHVIQAVEDTGFLLTGEYLQLNSYENRVFDLYMEPEFVSEDQKALKQRVIAKFYRPGRWTEKAILEEHEFLEDLKKEGVPVIAPLLLKNNTTISQHNDIYLSLFPKGWGRLPQELDMEDLKSIGRVLAHIHNVGERKRAKHRPQLLVEQYGDPALDILEHWVSPEVKYRYMQAAEKILDVLVDLLDPSDFIRIHGDCHKGNILEFEGELKKHFFLMDFDDFCMGPVAQDFWMLFSDEKEQERELHAILEGYKDLRHFPEHQMQLFQPLRGLRMIHYSGWIARRYEDPLFPATFPQFQDYIYWAQETEALEKIAWSL